MEKIKLNKIVYIKVFFIDVAHQVRYNFNQANGVINGFAKVSVKGKDLGKIMNLEDYKNSNNFSATYSPEDNKLRLYFSKRVSGELWAFLKDAGFGWAQKQDLLYCTWSPAREDVCAALAEEIEMEETTLVERAEAKAARLEELSHKREREGGAYLNAARELSKRFYMGQPILVGHHSERKARRDKDKMESATRIGQELISTSNYWKYRAEGVEAFANMKNSRRTRVNRIKTLLAELRGYQRQINNAHRALGIWSKIEKLEKTSNFEATVKYYAEFTGKGGCAPYLRGNSVGYQLEQGVMTAEEAIGFCKSHFQKYLEGATTYRWINHTLNRLEYENEMLGETEYFSDNLTPTIIKAFARTQGAEKPECKKVTGGYELSSKVPLPLHIFNGHAITLSDVCWRHLMKDSAYTVPNKVVVPAKPPILNFKAIEELRGVVYGRVQSFEQVSMTKDEYRSVHKDYRGVKHSECGKFRFKIAMVRCAQTGRLELKAVFLSDSKAHEAPEPIKEAS